MMNWKVKTPVVLILYNRPQTAAQVFEAIRQARPPQLFVIADGPRKDRPDDVELCKQTRSIIERVDWDCQVFKNYSDINLGCRKRIGETGLPWVFEQVEEAIILEDDCCPDITFFQFCQDLLKHYRDNERIMAICGTNHLLRWKNNSQSYHFSYHFNAWGWASWRRVIQKFDVDMKLWGNLQVQSQIRKFISDEKQFLDRKRFFHLTYADNLDAWDYQMAFLCLSQAGLIAIPSRNLISNIGFDENATNTLSKQDIRANMPTYPMSFPLQEPIEISIDRDFENRRYKKLFDRSLLSKIHRKISLLKNINILRG